MDGKGRRVGMPRLIRFIPTDKTIVHKGAGQIRGNCLRRDDGALYGTYLHTGSHASTDIYDAFKDAMQARLISDSNKAGVYVLASPYVKIDPNKDCGGRRKWRITGWIVHDFNAQIYMPSPDMTRKPTPNEEAKCVFAAELNSSQMTLALTG